MQTRYVSKDENQILKYLPLVESIVDKMSVNSRQGLERDDYISLGVIGLMDALEKYDQTQNIPFEHYARWRIRGAIYDELRKNGTVSRNRMDKLNTMYKARTDLQQTLLREPSDQEICMHMSIEIEQLHSLYETVHYLSQSYLEETLFIKDDEYNLLELIEDENAPNPQLVIEDTELKQELEVAIDKLSEREKIILNLYYKEELPLKEIAAVMEVSVSRISQIHGKIIVKLKKMMETQKQ